jgi:hypothetical protein
MTTGHFNVTVVTFSSPPWWGHATELPTHNSPLPDGLAASVDTPNPAFTVAEHLDTLHQLHEQIQADGSFVTDTSRLLIEARKPA